MKAIKLIDNVIHDGQPKIKLRKIFNEDGLLVDELMIACVKNPYKSET